MNPSFAHNPSEVPPIPPQIAKMEQERKEALSIVLAKIQEKERLLGVPVSVTVYERAYPIREGSEVDTLVASVQMKTRAAQEVLKEIKGVDYRQEQAAAKMVELLEVNELLTGKYAEILEHFPSLREEIRTMMVSLSALPSHQSTESSNADEKYLIH